MSAGRYGHTATLMANADVLVTGGIDLQTLTILGSAEVYHPASDSWSAAAPLAAARYGHAATLLGNGDVLVMGGRNALFPSPSDLASAELYDPVTGAWSDAGSLSAAREQSPATLLATGNGLVAGGRNPSGPLPAADLYARPGWSPAGSMSVGRENATATLLRSGDVLVAG